MIQKHCMYVLYILTYILLYMSTTATPNTKLYRMKTYHKHTYYSSQNYLYAIRWKNEDAKKLFYFIIIIFIFILRFGFLSL